MKYRDSITAPEVNVDIREFLGSYVDILLTLCIFFFYSPCVLPIGPFIESAALHSDLQLTMISVSVCSVMTPVGSACTHITTSV